MGRWGESATARWYQARGYEIVARNWRCAAGEIDLVARRGTTLVICEVKTRSTDAYGTPFAAVTPAKQARLRRLAGCYLAEAGRGFAVRIDVAGVTPRGVEVIESAC